MDLHNDQLDMVSDIEDRIRNKMVEIETSDVLCEEGVEVWLENIKREIRDVQDSSSFELKVAKDPKKMKDASDMIVNFLSPNTLVEVEAEASKLLAAISKGLNEHYDRQATSAHFCLIYLTNILLTLILCKENTYVNVLLFRQFRQG